MSVRASTDWELDSCLRRILSGEELEAVLPSDPAAAERLRPVLQALVAGLNDVPPSRRRASDKAAFLAAVAARREAVQATDRYVRLIKRGLPLERLLARVPDGARPVILAAHGMYSLAPPPPLHRTAAKRQLMAAVARRRLNRRRPVLAPEVPVARLGQAVRWVADVFWAPRPAWARVAATLAAVVVTTGGLAGIGTAAAGSVPGQPFYGLKRLGETAQLAFAFDPLQRADLSERFHERRLSEMVALAGQEGALSARQLADWLRGDPHASERVLGLPMEDQRRLARAVLQAIGDGGTGQAAGDRASESASLRVLVAWAQQVAILPATQVAEWPRDLVDPSRRTVEGGPLPLPRPLPPEDLVPRAARRVETPLPAPRVPTVSEPALQPLPSVPVVEQRPPREEQPVVIQPSDGARPPSNQAGAAQPAGPPAEPPPATAPASGEVPPPFLQPPAAEPATPTPEPGGSDTTTP